MIVQTLCYRLTHKEPALWARLEWYAQQEGLKLTEKNDQNQYPVLKIGRARTSVLWQGEELFFHPSMALLRLLGVLRGEQDRFLQAAALCGGDHCIDATMGFAADTLLAAWQVGKHGGVRALEASPVIAALAKEGLKELAHAAPGQGHGWKAEAWRQLAQAAGRIEIHLCDHLDYLRSQSSGSVDLIYFDPMFRHTRSQSAALRPLKPWICRAPLSEEAVKEARRVARRVVLKERNGSREFTRLGFTEEPGGRYSPVAFGVIAQPLYR